VRRKSDYGLERCEGPWVVSTPGFCDEELIFFRAWNLEPPPADSPHKRDDDG
jgi:hypothetical protein